MVLWEVDSINVKALGEYLYLDSGTMTPVLKKMESKGYITRTRSQSDERSISVSLTEKGRALRKKAAGIPEQLSEQVKLTEDEAKQLQSLLFKMLKGLE